MIYENESFRMIEKFDKSEMMIFFFFLRKAY